MGILANPRHEQLATALAAGESVRAFAASHDLDYSHQLKVAKRPEVVARIVELLQTETAAATWRKNRIREEAERIAFSDVADYTIEDNGQVTPTETADEGATRAVQSVRVKRRVIPTKDGEPIVEVETEMKLWNKPGALAFLADLDGLSAPKRTELTGKDGAPLIEPQSVKIGDQVITFPQG